MAGHSNHQDETAHHYHDDQEFTFIKTNQHSVFAQMLGNYYIKEASFDAGHDPWYSPADSSSRKKSAQ